MSNRDVTIVMLEDKQMEYDVPSRVTHDGVIPLGLLQAITQMRDIELMEWIGQLCYWQLGKLFYVNKEDPIKDGNYCLVEHVAEWESDEYEIVLMLNKSSAIDLFGFLDKQVEKEAAKDA